MQVSISTAVRVVLDRLGYMLLEFGDRITHLFNKFDMYWRGSCIIGSEPYFLFLAMANQTSQHILNTSATLLGICLFVISSLRMNDRIETSLIDDFTSVVAVLLTFSCLLSFVSIRTKVHAREIRLELIADYLFMFSLAGILITILLITSNFIH